MVGLSSTVKGCIGFVLSSLLAISLQIYLFSPISPLPLSLPQPTFFPSNAQLQRVIKVGEGILDRPEGICVDKKGVLYTATRDGWIKRMFKNGTWQNWMMIGTHSSLLGITSSSSGHIILCDTQHGLIKVGEDGVNVLVSHVNGSKIRFADDVKEGSDGSLYFSIASTKFGLHEWYLDVLEAKPHGQLLKYNPNTNKTSLLLDHLGFANGVALSPDEDYLIVCETWKFRCLKYWLKEEIRGKTEIFIDNLPGGPDNINLAPDGSFWIALIQIIKPGTEFWHSSRVAKHVIATFPKLFNSLNGAASKAMVVNVGKDGKIVKFLDDPNGKVISFVTSALEFEDNLYFGNLNNDFIGKLPLKKFNPIEISTSSLSSFHLCKTNAS